MEAENKYCWINISKNKLQEKIELPSGWKFYQIDKYLNQKEYFDKTNGCEIVVVTEENENVNEKELFSVVNHINNSGYNPLIGKNEEKYGSRFPDMSKPYLLDNEILNIPSKGKIIVAGGNVVFKGKQLLDTKNIVYQSIIASHQLKGFYGFIISTDNGLKNFSKLIQKSTN